MNIRQGVRAIALFEAAKGLLVLGAGFGLLSLVHSNLQAAGEMLVGHFHLNPASRYPHIFMQLLGNISSRELWGIAGYAFAYATLRLVEAYGLWGCRKWAEWLAVGSGGLYVPVEVYELFHGASWIKAGTLSLNLAIVGYMAYALNQNQA